MHSKKTKFHNPNSPVDYLRQEYCRRREKNPQYSLRAFARSLRMPSGRLSEILAKKRGIGQNLAKKICDGLMLEPKERNLFLKAAVRQKRSPSLRAEEATVVEDAHYQQLSEDAFYLVSDWFHYGILGLMKTEDFVSDYRWMAKRLGISVVEVQAAVERLQRLGAIKETTDKQFVRSIPGPLTTTHDIPSAALKRSHKQSLVRAISAIDELEVHERDITSVTIACDPERLGEVKELIKKFRRSLAKLLESGPKREVFELNIQFVPLTRRR